MFRGVWDCILKLFRVVKKVSTCTCILSNTSKFDAESQLLFLIGGLSGFSFYCLDLISFIALARSLSYSAFISTHASAIFFVYNCHYFFSFAILSLLCNISLYPLFKAHKVSYPLVRPPCSGPTTIIKGSTPSSTSVLLDNCVCASICNFMQVIK